jgi:hypothetical protein
MVGADGIIHVGVGSDGIDRTIVHRLLHYRPPVLKSVSGSKVYLLIDPFKFKLDHLNMNSIV